MTQHSVYIHDVLNDDVIVRPMTAEEAELRDAEIAEHLAAKAAKELDSQIQAEKKAEILEKLGLTADEAKILLS